MNAQARFEKMSEEERQFVRKVIKENRETPGSINVTVVLDEFCLLGTGLDIEDSTLHTGSHPLLLKYPSAEENRLKTKTLQQLPPDDLDFVKWVLIKQRQLGREAKLQNLLETFTCLGSGLTGETQLRQNNIHSEFMDYKASEEVPLWLPDIEEAHLSLLNPHKRDRNELEALPKAHLDSRQTMVVWRDANISKAPTSDKCGQQVLPPQQVQQHVPLAAQQENSAQRGAATPPTASTAAQCQPPHQHQAPPRPMWQQTHGLARLTADLAAEANMYYEGDIAYVHNPLYDTATGMPELLRLIHNDSVVFHEKSIFIFGPLFPVLYGNVSMVLGQSQDNDNPAAIALIKKLKEIVANIKQATPSLWRMIKEGHGFLPLSSDPAVAEMQRFIVEDMCRRVLRLIMVERAMKWLQMPNNRGSANNGAINNQLLQVEALRYMVLEYNDFGATQPQAPHAIRGKQPARGVASTRGGLGRGGGR